MTRVLLALMAMGLVLVGAQGATAEPSTDCYTVFVGAAGVGRYVTVCPPPEGRG